jgi:hypothetical protein
MGKGRDYPLASSPEPKRGFSVGKNDKGEIVETSYVNRQRPSGASVRKQVTTTHSIDKEDPSMYDAAYNKYTKNVTRTSKSGDVRTKTVVKEGGKRTVTRSKK